MHAKNSPLGLTVGMLLACLVPALARALVQDLPTLPITKEFAVAEARSKERAELATRAVRDFWAALVRQDLDVAAELCVVPFAFDRKELALGAEDLRTLLGKLNRLPPLSDKAVVDAEEQKQVILKNCVPLDFVIVSVSPEGSAKKVEFAVTVGKTAHVAGFSD